ncbi:MAG: nucleoside hydrolase [Planctomycetia bacterium]|nr:nucleoside hydrolase [Planctomycetia bacterium]
MTETTRKIILDVDPGIEEVLPMCMALYEPRFNVLGITACGGHVSSQRALHTIQQIIGAIDPPRLPRLGVGADLAIRPMPTSERGFWSSSGLENLDVQVADYFTTHPAEKILSDLIRSNPNEITLITLGPLTNVARAFTRDKGLASLVHRMIIVGGTVLEPGNATVSAEYNFYRDPQAARTIFQCPVAKTLVPLDITRKVLLDYDFLKHLPSDHTRLGSFLRKIIPQSFHLHRQYLGIEGMHAPGVVALMALLQPGLFSGKMMAGDIETDGELTRGMTVFDRRRVMRWTPNIDVLTTVDAAEILYSIYTFLDKLREPWTTS